MNVLLTLDSLNRGGAEILALDICRNAREFGIDLTLATLGGGLLESEFLESGVDVVRLDRRFPFDPSVAMDLRRVIAERDIRIVHAYQAVEMLHAYVASIGKGVRRVLSFHGHITDAKNRQTLKLLIPRMDANLVVSRALYESLTHDDRLDLDHNLRIVYNGIDLNRLVPQETDIRGRLGLPNGTVLLGMVANFYSARRKDHLTVCRALPRVFREMPEAQFIFVYGRGQNEDLSKLKECKEVCENAGIANRVHFIGDRFRSIDVVDSLDVFVLSSFHEGLPIAIKEAMLMNKPCVLSDIAPHQEISENGKLALLFKTGDPDDLADKLIGLLRDPAGRARLAGEARHRALDRYTIEAHLLSLKALYDSLIDTSRIN